MNLKKITKEILSQSYNITTESGEQLVVIESGDVLDILKRLASDGDLADVSESDSEFQLKRVYDWLMDNNRQPAQTKFTAGWQRNLAKEIEHRLSEYSR